MDTCRPRLLLLALTMLIVRSQGDQCASGDDDSSLMQMSRSLFDQSGYSAGGSTPTPAATPSAPQVGGKCVPPGPVSCATEHSLLRGGCLTCLPGSWPMNPERNHNDPDYYSVAATYGRFIVATVTYWAAYFHLHELGEGDSYKDDLTSTVYFAKVNYTNAKKEFQLHARDFLPNTTIEKMVTLVEGEGDPKLAFCDCNLQAREDMDCGHFENPPESTINCIADGGPSPYYAFTDLSGTMIDCGETHGYSSCLKDTLAAKLREVVDQARKFASFAEYGIRWRYPWLQDAEQIPFNSTLIKKGIIERNKFDVMLRAVSDDLTLQPGMKFHKDEAKLSLTPAKLVSQSLIRNSLPSNHTETNHVEWTDEWGQDWKLGITVGASLTIDVKTKEGFELLLSAEEGFSMEFHVDVNAEFGRHESHTFDQTFDFACTAPPNSEILCQWVVFRGTSTMSFEYNLTVGSAWWFSHGVWTGMQTSKVMSSTCYLNQSVGGQCPSSSKNLREA